MIRQTLIATAAALLAAVATVALAGKDEPKPTVAFARTWEAGVAEAKTLNLPIVVHSHGFY
jgi:hypothetical protein